MIKKIKDPLGKMGVRKMILISFILFFGNISYADDILEYLSTSYNISDTLKQSQMKFKNAVEAYPTAINGFLPQVSYNITKSTGEPKRIPTGGGSDASSGLNVAVPIFNGGGSMAALRIAENAYYAARLDWYSDEQKFLLDAIKSYIEYYEALQAYRISSTNVEAGKKTFESVEAQLKLGEATKTDLANAQAFYSENLAQRSNALSKLISAKSSFITTFGTDDENITLPKIPDLKVYDKEELREKILANNFDLNKAKYAVNINKLQILASASALAPSVTASLNVNHSPNNTKKETYTGAISVNIPIFNSNSNNSTSNAYSATRQAKNSLRSTTYQLSALNKAMRDQANILWSALEAYKLQVQYTQEASDAAQLAYEGTLKEESVGNKTILDVLTAQSKLYKSQIQHLEAQKNYLLQAYSLRQQIGELTAKSLDLKADIFEPEKEFKKIKFKIVGF